MACLLACVCQVRAQGTSDTVARNAKTILQKYCLACHAAGKQPRSGLVVFDHEQLVTKRQVVRPRAAQQSELLLLMQDGTMPPGVHRKPSEAECRAVAAWIDAGAPAFPPDYGETFVLQQILDDVNRLPPSERRDVRYFSFNHLLAAETEPGELKTARDKLEAALRSLGGGTGQELLVPVDPNETLFRVNIRKLGWATTLYSKVVKEEGKPATLEPWKGNAFDLVLLEYPYGVVPSNLPLWRELASAFLVPASQARPVPYVRADWFLDLVQRSPQAGYFRGALGKIANQLLPDFPRYLEPVRLAEAASELNWSGSEQPLREAIDKALAGAGLDPRTGDRLPRKTWERIYGLVARRLGTGMPILPLDALGWTTFRTAESAQITVWATMPGEQKPRTTFQTGSRLVINARSSEDVHVEILGTDSSGKINPVNLGTKNLVTRGTDRETIFKPNNAEGYKLTGSGREHIDVYAYPDSLLKGRPVPAGDLLRANARDLPDRVVHPFYQLRRDGSVDEPLDLGRAAKATIEYQIEAGPR